MVTTRERGEGCGAQSYGGVVVVRNGDRVVNIFSRGRRDMAL